MAKLPMKKGPKGKMIPEFAMDGKGANDMGKKKMKGGKMVKKGYARGGMAQAPQDESTMKKGRNRRPLQPGPLPVEEPTRPSLPSEPSGPTIKRRMKNGGMAKKGYAKGGKVRGAGIARKGTRPCKMR